MCALACVCVCPSVCVCDLDQPVCDADASDPPAVMSDHLSGAFILAGTVRLAQTFEKVWFVLQKQTSTEKMLTV